MVVEQHLTPRNCRDSFLTFYKILYFQVEQEGDIAQAAEDKMTPFGFAIAKGAQAVSEYFAGIGNSFHFMLYLGYYNMLPWESIS